MKMLAGILLSCFMLATSASAQTVCNDPSGFLKTFGPINLNDLLVLGPDCQHVTDGGNASALGVAPTQSVVTISIASPAIVTWPNHNLTLGATVIFSTTGALPTGLSAIPVNSNPIAVYAVPLSANTFGVASTLQNAVNGILISTLGTQSGTQTAYANAVACSGCIGETIWNVVPINSVFLTGTGNFLTWNTISLPPGVWEVRAQSGILGGSVAATSFFSDYGFGINTVRSVPCGGACTGLNVASNNTNDWIFSNMPTVVYNTTTQAMNAVVLASYGGTNPSAYGSLFARRIH